MGRGHYTGSNLFLVGCVLCLMNLDFFYVVLQVNVMVFQIQMYCIKY